MVLVATQVKRRRGTTAENDAFTGAEGEITVDTEKHQLRVHDGETQGGFVIGSGGSGHNIGDVFYTTRTDTSLAGAVECNGATYSTADYTGTGNIGELLRAGKLPYVSLSQYATLLSTNGVVGVFGWNGTGTTAFRVPTLKDVFIECGQASELGDYIPASIPNLKCSIGESNKHRNDGCLNVIDDGDGFAQTLGNASLDSSDGGSASMPYGFSLNASRVSSVYKDGATTVQPKAIKYRAMIQLFNATTDEAVATVGTVVAQVGALNTRTDGMIDYVIESQEPTAQNGYTWYRKYKSGWVEQGGCYDNGSLSADFATSITLPIQMQSANYAVLATVSRNTSEAYRTGFTNVYIQTTTQIGVGWYHGSNANETMRYINWQVSGMSA